ncbi:MAG: ABC transporter ATP-binding protein [Phycisphaerae bacterium]|nr:ABC transporter ATP-binding protein [Phycisphaerae bacterium]
MTAQGDSVVCTMGLTKIFRDFWMREKVTAVSALDMDIRSREVFGLLGPNGSGKSTTLKMILGLLFPTKGSITIFGKHPSNVRVKSRIGFLPEESNLYPFLDARETLDFYGRLFHQPRRQRARRIDMLLEMVGLQSVAYRRVGEYSKGMQRRIGLAQALINDPDLLILDEPTSGLDPLGTRQFKDLIRTLAERGKTVILSSHLLADVEDVCDRVCILYGGKKRAAGEVGELLAKKDLTQITTDSLDEATMEKIRAVLAGADKQLVDVSHPHDKLESLFLRIVEEARRQRLTTGGAVSGGKVAEFLTREESAEGRNIIESLVAEALPEPAEEPQAVEAQPAEPAVDDEMLGELVTGKAVEPGTAEEPPDIPISRQPREIDRGIIEGLLGDEDEKSSEEGGEK